MIAALLRTAAGLARIGWRALNLFIRGHRLRSQAVRTFRRELERMGVDGKAIGVLTAKYAKLPKSWKNP